MSEWVGEGDRSKNMPSCMTHSPTDSFKAKVFNQNEKYISF